MDSIKADFTKVPTMQIREGVYRSMIYTGNLMLVVLDFTNGPWSEPDPFHSHPHEQASFVADGEIIFYCEDRPEQHLKAGDTFAIASGKKHTIKVLTKSARVIDSFTPAREDFLSR